MTERDEKQAIEELAKVLEFVCDKIDCNQPKNCDLCQATRLYDEGYRRQSEIIDEFAERIKKDFTDYPNLFSWLEITEEGFCKRIDELVAEMKGGAE